MKITFHEKPYLCTTQLRYYLELFLGCVVYKKGFLDLMERLSRKYHQKNELYKK